MLNTTARQNTTPRTVLVVEDEPTLATAIAQRITAEGWTARVAGDGASAVQAASQLRPDLVIMDIMLPVMDGLEATKRIVAERPVPVLILTARDDEADKVIGLGAGADDYMTKPFSMRELIARCKALLRRVERAKVIAKNSENEKLLDFGSMVIDPAQRIVTRERRTGASDPHRVRSAGHAGPPPEVGAHPRKAARRGLGLGRRIRHPHRRQPRQGAAP